MAKIGKRTIQVLDRYFEYEMTYGKSGFCFKDFPLEYRDVVSRAMEGSEGFRLWGSFETEEKLLSTARYYISNYFRLKEQTKLAIIVKSGYGSSHGLSEGKYYSLGNKPVYLNSGVAVQWTVAEINTGGVRNLYSKVKLNPDYTIKEKERYAHTLSEDTGIVIDWTVEAHEFFIKLDAAIDALAKSLHSVLANNDSILSGIEKFNASGNLLGGSVKLLD